MNKNMSISTFLYSIKIPEKQQNMDSIDVGSSQWKPNGHPVPPSDRPSSVIHSLITWRLTDRTCCDGATTHWHLSIMVPIRHLSVPYSWANDQDWRDIPTSTMSFSDLSKGNSSVLIFGQRTQIVSMTYFSVELLIIIFSPLPPYSPFESVMNYLPSVWIYTLSSCSGTSGVEEGEEEKGRGWDWRPGFLRKSEQARRKCRTLQKVIATHWVSCDIFITEVKNAARMHTAPGTCTTFRTAAVIPNGKMMC